MKALIKIAVLGSLVLVAGIAQADTFATDYSDTNGRIESIDSNLAGLNAAVGAGFDTINEGLSNLNTELQNTNNHFNTELGNTNAEVNQLNETVWGVGGDPATGTLGTGGLLGQGGTIYEMQDDIDANAADIAAVDSAQQANHDAQQATIDPHSTAINALSAAATSATSDFARLDDRVDSLTTETRSAIAGVAAMSALVPNSRAAGNTQIAVGTGTYKGEVGLAAGAFHYLSDNVRIFMMYIQ